MVPVAVFTRGYLTTVDQRGHRYCRRAVSSVHEDYIHLYTSSSEKILTQNERPYFKLGERPRLTSKLGRYRYVMIKTAQNWWPWMISQFGAWFSQEKSHPFWGTRCERLNCYTGNEEITRVPSSRGASCYALGCMDHWQTPHLVGLAFLWYIYIYTLCLDCVYRYLRIYIYIYMYILHTVYDI